MPEMLAQLRVFAFGLLDSASGARDKTSSCQDLERLLRIANKTIKFCLENGNTQASTKVLERAADLEASLAEYAKRNMDTKAAGVYERLKVEYLCLRIMQVRMSLVSK